MTSEDLCLSALRQLKIQKQSLLKMYASLKSWEKLWTADMQLWKSQVKVSEVLMKQLQRRTQSFLEEHRQKLQTLDIQFLCPENPAFPHLLLEISSSPLGIYVKGNIDILTRPSLAIVGTRKSSIYGQEVLRKLLPELSMSSLSIVSGLAYGIDAKAHRLSLEQGLPCIAVLAHGLEQVQPSGHKKLAEEILAAGGALLSEYPPGTEVFPGMFPARNRLISGLSLGTLVVEAAKKSGSLITAEYALEQNREVFAIPGSIFSEYQEGCHELLRQGAHLVSQAADIQRILLDEPIHTRSEKKSFSDPQEQLLWDHLKEAMELDEISEQLQISLEDSARLTSSLELRGLIHSPAPGWYSRA